MSAITITNSYRQLVFYQQDTKTQSTTSEKTPLESQLKKTPSAYVRISDSAKEKLNQENKGLGKEIAEQIHEQKKSTSDKIDEATKKDGLDKMIEQIQKLIKDIQKRLRALRNKNSEAAKAEIKMLEAQLLNLNASLMALIGKKFDIAKG